MNREIKFRIIYKGKIDGYERLIETKESIHWEWMALDLNPDDGFERWNRGCYPHGHLYQREQFTGLKDKNGKDIFEGDVQATYEHGTGNLKQAVVFDNGSFCVSHKFSLINELRGWKRDYLEVIGNIHENPELLSHANH